MRAWFRHERHPSPRGVEAYAATAPTGPVPQRAPQGRAAWADVYFKGLRGLSTDRAHDSGGPCQRREEARLALQQDSVGGCAGRMACSALRPLRQWCFCAAEGWCSTPRHRASCWQALRQNLLADGLLPDSAVQARASPVQKSQKRPPHGFRGSGGASSCRFTPSLATQFSE